MNESHHANLADREEARSRMGRKGRVRPYWPRREPFDRLAAAPWHPAGSGRSLRLHPGEAGDYNTASRVLASGVSQSQMGNLG